LGLCAGHIKIIADFFMNKNDNKIKIKLKPQKTAPSFHRPTKKIKPKKGKGAYSRKKVKKKLKNEMKKN